MRNGGSYTKDPKTGKKTLNERTLSEAEAKAQAVKGTKKEAKKS